MSPELVSPQAAAREMLGIMRSRDFTRLFMKSTIRVRVKLSLSRRAPSGYGKAAASGIVAPLSLSRRDHQGTGKALAVTQITIRVRVKLSLSRRDHQGPGKDLTVT